MVGVEALASRLIQLQAQSIAGVLPRILKQIDDSMGNKWNELKQMGCEGITNEVNASVAFLNVSFSVRKSLEAILSGGAVSSSNPKSSETTSENQPRHHYLARLQQEFDKFSSMLTYKLTTTSGSGSRQVDWGLMDKIKQFFRECGGTRVPQSIIEKMLSHIIDSIADTCTSELPSFVHEEARKVAFTVVFNHARRFPYLKRLYTAAFQKSLNQCKSKCSSTIARLLVMEEAMIYTTGPGLYNSLVNKFNEGIRGAGYYYGGYYRQGSYYVLFDGLLRSLYVPAPQDKSGSVIIFEDAEKQAAFGVLAYWILLSYRLADRIPRELRFSFNEALLSATDDVVGQVVGGSLSMEQVMAELPEVANNRQCLAASLDVLQQSKELISEVLDDVCFF